MKDYKTMLKNYLATLHEKVGAKNATLIREFAEKLRATPSEPGASRIHTIVTRLKTISELLDHKPLDALTENDLIKLNNVMRDKEMDSAMYYRRSLKQFMRLTNKKKFIDLIDSEYLRSVRAKANAKPLVNPDEFWSQEQISEYVKESKHKTPRQTAWAGLWLSSGCRPHELLGLRKENVLFENNLLTIRVVDGKTGSRTIVIDGNEAIGAWNLVEPYYKTLKHSQQLFPFSYEYIDRVHKKICANIGIPEGNARKLYIARKMVLTSFYDKYGVVRGAAMAGHVPGSNSMKHYVGMSESQLTEGVATLKAHVCPNPNCQHLNETTRVLCEKCQSPLDQHAYGRLIDEIKKENAKVMMDALEGKFERLEKRMEERLRLMSQARA